MVRKVSMPTLRKKSYKYLDVRVGRLEAESRKVGHMLGKEMEKVKPSKTRMKELNDRSKIISQELRKTFRAYTEKGKAMRRKK